MPANFASALTFIIGSLAQLYLFVLILRMLLPWFRGEYRRRGLPGADVLSAADLALQLRALGAINFASLRRAAHRPLPTTLVAYAPDDPLIQAWLRSALATDDCTDPVVVSWDAPDFFPVGCPDPAPQLVRRGRISCIRPSAATPLR